jgi:hypothetical protein
VRERDALGARSSDVVILRPIIVKRKIEVYSLVYEQIVRKR